MLGSNAPVTTCLNNLNEGMSFLTAFQYLDAERVTPNLAECSEVVAVLNDRRVM